MTWYSQWFQTLKQYTSKTCLLWSQDPPSASIRTSRGRFLRPAACEVSGFESSDPSSGEEERLAPRLPQPHGAGSTFSRPCGGIAI